MQQKYALILQNRNLDVNAKSPFLNFNEGSINMTNSSEANLIELYSQAKKFHAAAEKIPSKKHGKIVKTTRNHQLVEKLTMNRKGHGPPKQKLETLPQDLSNAITTGKKMISKYNKRSRMKGGNLFTSNTTPTSGGKNSLKTTIMPLKSDGSSNAPLNGNNSMNNGAFVVNKSFWNKIKKIKDVNIDH